MCKIFVEYRIKPEYRELYFRFMQSLLPTLPQMEWYESRQQNDLFLEIWTVSPSETEETERDRLHGKDAPWRRMDEWVSGGRDSIRLWIFDRAGL